MTWCALQHIPKNSTSRIVNIGSRGAFRGEPVSPAYGASKAAIVAFGQSISKALAPMKIGVTTMAPGFMETDMAARLLDSPEGDGIRAQSPFNRVARPEELAKAVYFLAPPESEWASGAGPRFQWGLLFKDVGRACPTRLKPSIPPLPLPIP